MTNGSGGAGCPSSWLSCANGDCIVDGRMCDGTKQCHDGSDEQNCGTSGSDPCKRCSSTGTKRCFRRRCQCSKGYQGSRCSQCVDGYVEIQDSTCTKKSTRIRIDSLVERGGMMTTDHGPNYALTNGSTSEALAAHGNSSASSAKSGNVALAASLSFFFMLLACLFVIYAVYRYCWPCSRSKRSRFAQWRQEDTVLLAESADWNGLHDTSPSGRLPKSGSIESLEYDDDDEWAMVAATGMPQGMVGSGVAMYKLQHGYGNNNREVMRPVYGTTTTTNGNTGSVSTYGGSGVLENGNGFSYYHLAAADMPNNGDLNSNGKVDEV